MGPWAESRAAPIIRGYPPQAIWETPEMNESTNHTTSATGQRMRRAGALIALAGVGVTLAVAAPASAADSKPHSDDRPKSGCTIEGLDGTVTNYPDGTIITIDIGDGTKERYRCNDGKWEKARAPRAPRIRILMPGAGQVVTVREALQP